MEVMGGKITINLKENCIKGEGRGGKKHMHIGKELEAH